MNILSLDGGGMRGVLTARILWRLERACPGFLDKVDVIAGASTGGIQALKLASGGKVTELQWARSFDMGDNKYRVILASSEPVSNALAQHLVGQVKDDMTIMQLDLDANRVGTGVLQIGPELGVDSEGRITIQQRRVNPVKITSVNSKSLD